MFLVLFCLACLPAFGYCSSDGTKQVARISLVTDDGDSLTVVAPFGRFDYLTFRSGRDFWVVRQEQLDLHGRLALSDLECRFGLSTRRDGGGMVNIVTVPFIYEAAGVAGFSLGTVKWEFFEGGRAQISVFPSDDETDPIRTFSVPARRGDGADPAQSRM